MCFSHHWPFSTFMSSAEADIDTECSSWRFDSHALKHKLGFIRMLQHRVNTIPRLTEEYLIKKALSKGCYSTFVTAMTIPKNNPGNPGQENDNHCLNQDY